MTNKIKSVVAVLTAGTLTLSIVGCSTSPVRVTNYTSEIAKEVGITGAAGELRRLTFAGPEELVSDLSKSKEWLLIDTYKNRSDNRVMQKINVYTNSKVILTPVNSSNQRGIWNENDSKIIFNTDRTGGSSIVESMGVNGENGIKFITNNSLGTATDANINIEGNDIAFVLNGSISLIKPDGTQIRMFGGGFLPKFSPDGTKILFSKKTGDFVHLFVMQKDGTQLIEISTENANDFEGSWSPDGTKIAFISDRANNHKHLFYMSASGAGVTQLTDGNFDVSSLSWGSDGFIYFSANAGGNRDVWLLKPKG